MSALVLEGRVGPEDRSRSGVLLLPFDVPGGTTRIDVGYRFDDGHVLDLGLADGRFRAFPSRHGFRGWSGGARQRVFVATDDATPGYLPGPMAAGRWCVLLGLARVEGSCGWRVEIDFSDAARGVARPVPPDGRSWGGSGWYAGDLQAHTHHSDARGSLDDLAVAAAARGLDFVAVTDHNTVSHHRPIAMRAAANHAAGAVAAGRPLLIPGEEVTTYRGHANVWGATGWVDFRSRDDAAMRRVVQVAHALGGVFSVNHPKRQPGCIGCDWEYTVPEEADAFEAWQGPWPNRNWESLQRYDDLLRTGRRLTLVGGSDRHQPPLPGAVPDAQPTETDPPELRVGSPTTWIHAETLSMQGLLDGVRRGRVCVSEAPEGPHLEIEADGTPMGGTLPPDGRTSLRAVVRRAEPGDVLRWITPAGVAREVTLDQSSLEDAWTVDHAPRFVRAEVIARDATGRVEAWRERLLAAAGTGADVRAPLRELDEVRDRPWIRCLSNPLYASPDPPTHDRLTHDRATHDHGTTRR